MLFTDLEVKQTSVRISEWRGHIQADIAFGTSDLLNGIIMNSVAFQGCKFGYNKSIVFLAPSTIRNDDSTAMSNKRVAENFGFINFVQLVEFLNKNGFDWNWSK